MSLLAWFTGYDEAEAQRAADADAQLRALNEQRAAELGSEWKAKVDANYKSQSTFGVDAQKKEINTAFVEGWNEGKARVTGVIKGAFKVVGDVLGSVLMGIPLWAWLAVGVGVWVYLGTPGLSKLKKKWA